MEATVYTGYVEKSAAIQVLAKCPTSPFEGDTVEATYDNVVLHYNPVAKELHITGMGARVPLRNTFARLLGDGIAEVIEMAYAMPEHQEPRRLAVQLPHNTIDRIARYLCE